MRTYVYENLKLEQIYGKGSLFVNGRLVFKGDGYIAIKMFIHESGNAPEVIDKFKAQLNMREQLKWNKQQENNKNKEKMKPPEPPPPKKEKVLRRERRKIDKLFK